MTQYYYEDLFYVIKITGCDDQDRFIIGDEIDTDGESIIFGGYVYEEEKPLRKVLDLLDKSFDIDRDDDDWDTFSIDASELKKCSLKMKGKEVSRGIFNTVKEPHLEMKIDYNKESRLSIDVVHASKADNDFAIEVALDMFNDIEKMIRKHGAKADFGDSVMKDVKGIGKDLASLGKSLFSGSSTRSKTDYSDGPKFETYSGPADKIHAVDMDWAANQVIYEDDEGNRYRGVGDLKVKE